MNIAETLGKIGDKRGVLPLIATLKDEDNWVRRAAAEALGNIGDKRAVPYLISALQDKNCYVQAEAAKALGKIGDKRAVKVLIALIKDKDWPAREAAISALGNIGDKRAVKLLITTLEAKGEIWPIQEAIVEALGKLGDKRAIPSLITALKDKNSWVRKAAAEALDKLDWKPKDDTQKALYFIAKREWNKCIKLGKVVIEPLSSILKDENWLIRREVVVTLGKIGNKKAIKPLILALKDYDGDVRAKAAEALDKLGWEPTDTTEKVFYFVAKKEWDRCVEIGKPAVEPLIIALKDNYRKIRIEAVKALGKIGDLKAIALLEEVAEYYDEDLREIVKEALKKIQRKQLKKGR
jgi:HEAT repeat protein